MAANARTAHVVIRCEDAWLPQVRRAEWRRSHAKGAELPFDRQVWRGHGVSARRALGPTNIHSGLLGYTSIPNNRSSFSLCAERLSFRQPSILSASGRSDRAGKCSPLAWRLMKARCKRSTPKSQVCAAMRWQAGVGKPGHKPACWQRCSSPAVPMFCHHRGPP